MIRSLFFVAMLCSACTPIAKLIYGIHNPKIASVQDAKSTAIKYGMRVDNVFFPKDEVSYRSIGGIVPLPFPIIFSRNGYHLGYKPLSDTSSCQAAAFEAATNLCVANLYTDTSWTLQRILPLLSTADGAPVDSLSSRNYDYVVFIPYGAFLGKWNRTKSKYFEDILQSNLQCKSVVYKINFDLVYETQTNAK